MTIPPSLENIIAITVEAIRPSKIFLVGQTFAEYQSENVFMNEMTKWWDVRNYDLLVLVDDEKDKLHVLQDVVENRCRAVLPVNCLMMSFSNFNARLKAGHPFALKIFQANCVIYDDANSELNEPGKGHELEWQDVIAKDSESWYNTAIAFMRAAELHQLRLEYRMSAFSLHQAAEQFFMAIIHSVTGLRMNTHNLDKMHRNCRAYSSELAQLFPRSNEHEQYLFKLLQRAFTEARYKPEYKIKESELYVLSQQISILQVAAKQILKISQ